MFNTHAFGLKLAQLRKNADMTRRAISNTKAAPTRKRLFAMGHYRICTNPSFFCTLDRVLRAT